MCKKQTLFFAIADRFLHAHGRQNIWRRFYIGHVIPRPGGQVPQPFTATCVDDSFPGMLSNAAEVIRRMDTYAAGGHKFDYWWTDAGLQPARAATPLSGVDVEAAGRGMRIQEKGDRYARHAVAEAHRASSAAGPDHRDIDAVVTLRIAGEPSDGGDCSGSGVRAGRRRPEDW